MMMRSVTLALMLSAAAAFAPAQQAVKSASALNAIAPEKEVGVQAPIGFFE
jgi:hypothetical protein